MLPIVDTVDYNLWDIYDDEIALEAFSFVVSAIAHKGVKRTYHFTSTTIHFHHHGILTLS
jgi:hypothetical protein